MRYILTIDEGTTSVRAILFDTQTNKIEKIEQQSFKQYFPKPAWVEHDAKEIWDKCKICLEKVMKGIEAKDVYGIGITNQRETAVCWSKSTGESLYHAIVWQCRRTSKYCEKLKKSNKARTIKSITGLIPDAYFSATKYKWFLDNVPSVQDALKKDDLCFGTIESFLVYKLTNGKSFVSDVTNASRTMLFNINQLKWDDYLLKLFNIPLSTLPKIVANDDVVGVCELFGGEIKVAGLIGDQQSSLFGQGCFDKGMAKNTYGTGCFMLVNTSKDKVSSKHGLLTTIGYKVDGRLCYALEGSVFNAGCVVDWAIENLGIGKDTQELTDLATSLSSNEGVYLVPAFTGLGTPYWDMNARGLFCGLTRGTDKRHIARAVLEGMAYSTYDVLKTVEKDAKMKVRVLHVDGGASVNDFLMQFQSNLIQKKLERFNKESTCMGAVFMTGLATGAYKNLADIRSKIVSQKVYTPNCTEEDIKPLLKGWKTAINRTIKSK
jgi:glycerol kinase